MPLLTFKKLKDLESSKVTKWIHYHLDGNCPLNITAVVDALLDEGFVGQLRIHFDGSHILVRKGEIVFRENRLVKPLTNGPSMR